MIDRILGELIELFPQKNGEKVLPSKIEKDTLMSISQNQMPEATKLCQNIEDHFGIKPLARWGVMNILQIAEQIVKERKEWGSVEGKVLAILSAQLYLDIDETRKKLEREDLDITENLGADSLDAVEIIQDIEDREEGFGIHVEDDEAEKNTSFWSIVALVKRKLKKL